jgi:hypothetical protein
LGGLGSILLDMGYKVAFGLEGVVVVDTEE